MIEYFIPKGWRFFAADFSIRSGDDASTGRVTLVRDKESKKKWFNLDDEIKERRDPPLYVIGIGNNLQEATIDASKAAQEAGILP